MASHYGVEPRTARRVRILHGDYGAGLPYAARSLGAVLSQFSLDEGKLSAPRLQLPRLAREVERVLASNGAPAATPVTTCNDADVNTCNHLYL